MPQAFRAESHTHRLRETLSKVGLRRKPPLNERVLGLPRRHMKEPAWRVAVDNEMTVPTEVQQQRPIQLGFRGIPMSRSASAARTINDDSSGVLGWLLGCDHGSAPTCLD